MGVQGPERSHRVSPSTGGSICCHSVPSHDGHTKHNGINRTDHRSRESDQTMSTPRLVVDRLRSWPQRAEPGLAERYFGNGKPSCHLTIDCPDVTAPGALEPLHLLAERIGLRRAWFQNHPTLPHYDLTPQKRALAVAAGAVEVEDEVFGDIMKRARAAHTARKAVTREGIDRIAERLASGLPAQLLLPKVGITLLPPWWWLVLWAGKRIENRAPSVASRVKGWTGLMAMTSSKPTAAGWEEALDAVESVRRMGFRDRWEGPDTWTLKDAKERSGCVVGVLELVGVRPNGREPTDPWAVPGEHGLLLGRVLEVEPLPCAGGRGVFAFGACKGCGRPGAIENRGEPLVCRACKETTAREDLGRPMLNVRKVFGAGAYS